MGATNAFEMCAFSKLKYLKEGDSTQITRELK